MGKSLRSRSERKKRREKREKFLLPREKALLLKMANAAKLREETEAAELQCKLVEQPRVRKQLVRHNHVRSMRSGPKPYQIEEILEKEYVPAPRDYERFLDDAAMDSDDNDVLSDSDSEFQMLSRAQDKRSAHKKKKIIDTDGLIEKELRAYKKKHKRYPKWLNKADKKRILSYTKKGTTEDELIFDYT